MNLAEDFLDPTSWTIYRDTTGFTPSTGKNNLPVSAKLVLVQNDTELIVRKLQYADIIFGEGVSQNFVFTEEQTQLQVSFKYKTSENFSPGFFRVWAILNETGEIIPYNFVLDKALDFQSISFTIPMKDMKEATLCFHLSSVNFEQVELKLKDLVVEAVVEPDFPYFFPEGMQRDLEIEYRKRMDGTFPVKIVMDTEPKVVTFWSKLQEILYDLIDPKLMVFTVEEMIMYFQNIVDNISDSTPAGDYTVGYYNLLSALNQVKALFISSEIDGIEILSTADIIDNDDFPLKDYPLVIDGGTAIDYIDSDFRNIDGNEDMNPYIEKFVNKLISGFDFNVSAKQDIVGGKIISFSMKNTGAYTIIGEVE